MSVKVICYLSFGYPTIEGSAEMAEYYIKGGCDAIELSIPPKNPYRDSAYLQDLFHKAMDQCSDYEEYLNGIARMTDKHPETEFFFVLYHEVIMAIGAGKLGNFCREHHITNIISGDLHDQEAIDTLHKCGVKLARSVNYKMEEADIERCIQADGFTYMQAFPSEGQYIAPGYEELETCIRYLRTRKVSEPIYCGAGIKCPEDAARVKAAGGDGFFVGSSIIKLYEKPDELVKLIQEYKQAVQN